MQRSNSQLPTRHTALRVGVAVIGIGGIGSESVEAADEREVRKIGKLPFFEVKLEQDYADELLTRIRCGYPEYALSDQKVMVSEKLTKDIKMERAIVASDSEMFNTPQTLFGREDKQIPVESDLQGVNAKYVLAEESYKLPSVSVDNEDGTANMMINGESYTVPPNNKRSFGLEKDVIKVPTFEEKKEVENPRDVGPEEIVRRVETDPKPIEISPTITVANRGIREIHEVDADSASSGGLARVHGGAE